MLENVKVGRIYRRSYKHDHIKMKKFSEEDYVITEKIYQEDNEEIVKFYYLDEPDSKCDWNMYAFREGMEEVK